MKHALNLTEATDEDVEITTHLLLFRLLELTGGSITLTLNEALAIRERLQTKILRFSYGTTEVQATIETRPSELQHPTGNA